MKISTFILSVCGFCIFYICNADWIDELIEDYLGTEYEEVAPFISSVTAGTEEFDQLVEELARSKRRWWTAPGPFALIVGVAALSVVLFLRPRIFRRTRTFKSFLRFLSDVRRTGVDKEEIQTIVAEFLDRKLKQLCGNKQTDDVPVKLLWKGGSLVESTIHCNIREEAKFRHVRRRLLQSKLLFETADAAGAGESAELAPSLSETSTARKMAEIRKLLESEQDLEKSTDEASEGEHLERRRGESLSSSSSCRAQKAPEQGEDLEKELEDTFWKYSKEKPEKKAEENGNEVSEAKTGFDREGSPDSKLMNRIRLLESRLRLEELKNKNWINRMSRAEGILQQLNKQVERIEETRPMGTLTETLKITSTVTNWAPPASHPRRNMQFTLVNQQPSYFVQAPYTSLSELIKKEIGLPTPDSSTKNSFQFPPSPQIPALPSPIAIPQSSFLSKFLCR